MTHKLSAVNEEKRKGVCAVCGPVSLHVVGTRPNGSTRFACAEAKKARARKQGPRPNNRSRTIYKPIPKELRKDHTWHRLFNIDVKLKTARCNICGPGAKVIFVSNGSRWVCAEGKRIARKKSYIKRYGFEIDPDKETKRQKGRCLICRKKKRLFIDHCHSRNEFRGMLCPDCNSMLGFAHDNQKTLLRAIVYLRKRGNH